MQIFGGSSDGQATRLFHRIAPSSSRLRLPTRRRRFGFALHARRSSRICKDHSNSIHTLTVDSSRGKFVQGVLWRVDSRRSLPRDWTDQRLTWTLRTGIPIGYEESRSHSSSRSFTCKYPLWSPDYSTMRQDHSMFYTRQHIHNSTH